MKSKAFLLNSTLLSSSSILNIFPDLTTETILSMSSYVEQTKLSSDSEASMLSLLCLCLGSCYISFGGSNKLVSGGVNLKYLSFVALASLT